MLVGADLATRGLLESDRVLLATCSASRDLIGYLDGLKPHGVVDVVRLVSLEDLLIHRGEESLIGNSRLVEAQVLKVVAGVRLVKRVEANYPFVVRESLGSVVPVGDEFVLETLLVVVESIGYVQSFRGSVVHSEIVLLAVRDERIAILVLSVAIIP